MAATSVGAPPDQFAPDGQIWHLPPPNPLAVAAQGYAATAALFAANMRHAGALRIDHVMGLTRLFCIPSGGRGAEGAYVRYPLEDLIGVLALESQIARCLMVGEDLGTVPEGLRDRLAAADILSYRVLWFERDGLAFAPPSSYPARAVACVSTHDLPTLAGWWAGSDIEERRELGLWSADAAERATERRVVERGALAEALREAGTPPPEPAGAVPLGAVHAFIAKTPAVLVLAQADDLAGERTPVNLPGTDRERANWRRRQAVLVDALLETPQAEDALAALSREREPADVDTISE
jgi:glycogen operon protein